MDHPPLRSSWITRASAVAFALTALAGCVASPVIRDAPTRSPRPDEVATAPERYHGVEVVWGGKILGVRNLADTTEVDVVAYPLDASQRPDQAAPAQGRFILVLPGYVEPLDFPPGRFLSVRGQCEGTRVVRVDGHDVTYPQLRNDELHRWPVNFPRERGRVSFGVGLGVGIR